ncbi:MAG: TonB-dependent receptor, partial [Leeuwenhoekiella sp.]
MEGKMTVKSIQISWQLIFTMGILLVCTAMSNAQTISGTVTADGQPLPGANIIIKGTSTGQVTDFNGNYTIDVSPGAVLVFSYVGFKSQEVAVEGSTEINVELEADNSLNEVVVVGYGTQRKESVVGAITQIDGEELLERNGGTANVEEALQGNLPGVTTIQGSGIPGQSDVQIFIRGQSSWNGGGQPLILVDGVERSISDIDLNEIEKISVLKDASATAVFGVRGGDGVILLTTKRGLKGKAQLSLSFNTTLKTVSKLPQKLNSYDAVLQTNASILRELSNNEDSWDFYRPLAVADRFRNPANAEEAAFFPNIDWEDEILKDFAQDYRVNLTVRGGGNTAKYFGSLAFQSVSDIFDGTNYDNGKGYLGEYRYDRFNYRSNIDFNITKTTELSVNLAGYLGVRENPGGLNLVTNAIYELAPNIYTPVYDDGLFGRFRDDIFSLTNPIVSLTNTGYETTTLFQINTDFIVNQKLDFITENLSFRTRFSFDNNLASVQNLTDNGRGNEDNVTYRVINGENIDIISPVGVNQFDFVTTPWTLGSSNVQNGSIARRILYDFSFNYDNTFGDKHNVTALALLRREEFANGSQFANRREDWVSRVTYNYDSRYFLDVSGAYNGTEKFSRDFRFDLFPAIAAGWTVSNEKFMDDVDWLNKLKFRGSYGAVGSDNVPRFRYLSSYTTGGRALLDTESYNNGRSPYVFFSEDFIANPFLQWETAIKANAGVELGLFNNRITAEFDYFTEDREDIFIRGSDRSVPDFVGAPAPDFNGGAVEVRGFEFVIGANYAFANGLSVRGDFNFTQAKDEVLLRDDPLLTPSYQKQAGFPIGQPRTGIPAGILTNWDDIYLSTPLNNEQVDRRPGYYDLVDFDGDGAYDSSFDNAPYGPPIRPQRTWNLNLGANYKGVDLQVQFYGVQNSLRNYGSRTFTNLTDVFFEQDLPYWTTTTPNNTRTQPTFAHGEASTDPRSDLFDSSLTRLRSVVLSYSFPKSLTSKLGVSSLRFFANGTNLFLWTDLPDDREFNGNITDNSSFRGDYPTLR